MSDVAVMIRRCRKLGAEFLHDGAAVRVRAPEPWPVALEELVGSLREHKPEVIEHLRQDVIKHEPSLRLLYRLRMGQRWLTEQRERFLDDDESAASDEVFSRGMDTWHTLEQQLRSDQGYSRCIHGQGGSCPSKAVVRCSGCP